MKYQVKVGQMFTCMGHEVVIHGLDYPCEMSAHLHCCDHICCRNTVNIEGSVVAMEWLYTAYVYLFADDLKICNQSCMANINYSAGRI